MHLDIESLQKWLTEHSISFAANLVTAALILLIGRWVSRSVVKAIRKMMVKKAVDPELQTFTTSLTYALLMVVVVLAALGRLGVQTSSLVAILGAAGLAVGLALQGSLSNFAAGVLIILFRPFRIGDYIDAGGVAGTVKEITILTTVLHSPDNMKIIVPNSSIMGGTITNVTANDTRRCDMVFGVGYSDDLPKVRQVLEELVAADDRCLKDPAPAVNVASLGDSSVNFNVRPWVKKEDYWDVFFDMQKNVKMRFDKEGISIPFPQRDIHLYQDGPRASASA